MNRHAKEIVELAQLLGFTVEKVNGSGHLKVTCARGSMVLPTTPSEYRGRANALAQMERLSGKKLPRPNHRRSHKKPDRSGFTIDKAVAEQRSWHNSPAGETVDDLWAERERLIEQAHELAGKRDTLRRIPGVLLRIAAVEADLELLHQPVEPFDPFTLQA